MYKNWKMGQIDPKIRDVGKVLEGKNKKKHNLDTQEKKIECERTKHNNMEQNIEGRKI